jgi:hypothetical protein
MGHSYADAVDYTPRQMAAFFWLGQQRRKREQSSALSIGALAARGEPKAIKKLQRELAQEV